MPLEADNMVTRSNDGRADPHGGFWIGTMGRARRTAGGRDLPLFRRPTAPHLPGITIPNAICFAPDGRTAYFTDTPTRKVMAQPLGADGWPEGAPRVLIDLTTTGSTPTAR